jgi:hypothetical protein
MEKGFGKPEESRTKTAAVERSNKKHDESFIKIRNSVLKKRRRGSQIGKWLIKVHILTFFQLRTLEKRLNWIPSNLALGCLSYPSFQTNESVFVR